MFKHHDEFARKIIPRWRTPSSFIASGGFETKGTPHLAPSRINKEIVKSEHAWLTRKDELSAVEYIATLRAISDSTEKAQEAIEFLHSIGSKSFQEIIKPKPIYKIELPPAALEVGLHAKEISSLRHHLRSFPKDPFAWLDLAKLYTLCGMAESQQAQRAVQAATTLAPNNRYVLRSAVRFYIHINDPDKAVWVLEHSKRSNIDPWLSSALISSREIAGKSHLKIKQSQQILDNSNWSNIAKSELSTAMGDLAIKSGKIKQGKKLYKNALIDPNENVLAQALWTQEHMQVTLIKEPIELTSSVSNSFEAQAIQFDTAENWPELIEMCTLWQNDEPFSSKPAIMGSYRALTFRTNISSAIELLEKACLANPNEPLLRNNLAFSYAVSGNLR